ncbi:hypothetical protein TRIATDRAFT_291161 [Trichoderma atroviride IMI 206040]|uniref:Major facilitator superfamily (MFS) profile domain-containing protein n=1 Tax=Hypocrea atroviridis (strain ATCC 20476 / IMI 206040) TaxID=452589 RepID=G9NQN1_HYPAI|nr:uncharacterized protein TRIATDRAFT_291161 [Trichoderma atroviride IMI 206040]EHK46854.1 hypothetical protein TRIATDRAFT_291161 [Trichoderma atroviride IMI 206040]
MGFLTTFLPPGDRYAALLLYGMVLSTCFNGYDAGIMTVILADSQFIEYYSVDANRSGIIASIPWAATGVAQLFLGGTLAGFLGRLWALRISIVIMIVGVVVQSVPNTFGVLILGRLLSGLGFGCVYIATSLYVAECSPKALRGSFVGTVTQFGYQLGTLVAFWAGYGMSFHDHPFNVAWRVSNLIQIPIGLSFIFISFWYPESPRWVLEKHPEDTDRVMNILCKLRMGAPDSPHVQEEYHELMASYLYRQRFKSGYIRIFTSAALRKRLLYGFYATALQQAGGIAALTMYAAIVVCLFIVGMTYCWSNGPIAPAIASEIFPQEVRDKAFGISLLGQTACLLAITQPWPKFNEEVGGRSYWLLLGLNALCLLSVIFILPETKGVSLERMDAIFGEVDAVEAGEEAHGDKLEMVDVKQEEVNLEAEIKGESEQ